MNIINNNINWVYKSGTFKYINQDQLNNLSDDQKKFLACKCGKKPEFRWIKSEQTDSYGLFYGISPFKGRNGEELCCKCANFCYHCGREEERYVWSYHEDTEDNPSGSWAVRCCPQCWDKYSNTARPGYYDAQQQYEKIKPGSNKRDERVDKKEGTRNCDYCGKLFTGETTYYCAPCGTFYCSSACCEASAPQCKNKSGRKNQERISNEANDKPKTSVENTNTSIEGNEKGTPQSIIENNKHAQENDKNYLENDDKNDNWSKPVKLIINENNSPQPVKSSSEGNQRSSEFLVINLKDIKKITLTSDGDLIIEFNQPENNSDKSLSRTITTEQINTNQELQTVKNYCQRNGKNSLSQQELNNLINSNKTSASTNKSKDDNNSALAIGLSVAVALIVGLVIGLVVKRKKRN